MRVRMRTSTRNGLLRIAPFLVIALGGGVSERDELNRPTQLSSGGGSFPSLVPAEVHDAYETYSKFKYGTQTLDDGDLSHPTAKFSSKPGDTGKLAGTSCDLGHNNKDQRHHPNYTRAYHLADQPPWASNSITKLKALGKVPVGHGENAHSMGQLGDASSLTSHSVLPSTYMQPPRYNQLSIPGSTSFTAFSASHARLAPLSDGPSLSDELRRTTNAQTEALRGTPPRLSGMKAGDYDGTKRFVGSIEEIDGMAGGIRGQRRRGGHCGEDAVWLAAGRRCVAVASHNCLVKRGVPVRRHANAAKCGLSSSIALCALPPPLRVLGVQIALSVQISNSARHSLFAKILAMNYM